MKIVLGFLCFILLGCVVKPKSLDDMNKINLLNKSVQNLIKRPSGYQYMGKYIANVRQEAFVNLQVNQDSINKLNYIVFIEELDPIAGHSVTGELLSLSDERSILYHKENEKTKVGKSSNRVTGRDIIIRYLKDRDFKGLEEYATEKSKGLSDGNWIFIFFCDGKNANSYLLPQFSLN